MYPGLPLRFFIDVSHMCIFTTRPSTNCLLYGIDEIYLKISFAIFGQNLSRIKHQKQIVKQL